MEISSMNDGSVGRFFGLERAPFLQLVPLKSAPFSITRLYRKVDETEPFTVSLPAQDAYFLMLYLEDVRHCDILTNGEKTSIADYPKGSMCLVDLSEGADICLYSRLDSLAFVIPYSLFDEIAALTADPSRNNLKCLRGQNDAVMGNICLAILPILEGSSQTPPATLQHIAIAVCAHLLHKYGVAERNTTSIKDEVSGFDGQSFANAFEDKTGQTPELWFDRLRVERAKVMLENSLTHVSFIAKKCGFYDLRHFSEIFMRHTGMSPSAWRNHSRH